MANFMRRNFNDSLQNPTFILFVGANLIRERWHESMQTLNTSICWNSVTETKVAQVLCEKINISEGDDSDGIRFAVLNWADNLLKDADSVVLFRSHPVHLGAEVFYRNGVKRVFV